MVWPTEHAVVGAAPPRVFRRCTKVVLNSRRPPVGPFSLPRDCSRRHGIAPLLGQLSRSVPPSIEPIADAHTLLVSKELCQVALPLSGTETPGSGFSLILRKCVM